MIKNIEYYLSLDYEIRVYPISESEGGGFFAYYTQIQGVMGDGESESEAVLNAQDAFKCYILNQFELGLSIIEPNQDLLVA